MDALRAYSFAGGSFAPTATESAIQALAQSVTAAPNLVPMLGAGVSYEWPAGLPLARDFVKALHDTLGAFLPNHRQRIQRALHDKPLEHLLDQIGQVVLSRALDVLDVLDPANTQVAPTISHTLFARLARHGVRLFLTCNFDSLLEAAFIAAGEMPFVPEAFADEAEAYRRVRRRLANVTLFKLHGTIGRRESLFTTIELVGAGLGAYKYSALRRLLSGTDLFFAGYSDNDTDIFPAISTIPVRRVFWYEHPLQFDRLQRSAEAAHTRAFLARTNGIVLVGELRDLLTKLFRVLEPSAALPIPADLDARTDALRDERRRQLETATEAFAQANFNVSAAALLFARAVGADDIALANELFGLVQFDELSEIQRIAYWNEAAERGEKSFGMPIHARESILKSVLSDSLPVSDPERQRLYVEHAFKLSWDLDDARRPSVLLRSWRLRLGVVRRLLTRSIDDRYAVGTALSIMLARAARFPAAAARVVSFRAALQQQAGRTFPAALLRGAGRILAGLSCPFYALGRRIRYQQQGWLRIHRQSGGVMLVLAAGRVTRHAAEVIEAGQTTAFTRGTRAWQSRMTGVPVIYRAAYRGKVNATIAAWKRTIRYATQAAEDNIAAERARQALVICAAHLVQLGKAPGTLLDATVRAAKLRSSRL